MEKYNVLVVDDEYPARMLLQDYVSKVDSLNLVDCCSSAVKAMDVLANKQVDIMLLDIQMPEMTGETLLKRLDKKPAVILTTAYSEYAVDAFALDVVDYLLKPFDFARFLKAVNKAKELLGKKELPQPSADYMMVKADYKLYKINYDDLLFVEGQHEYVSFNMTMRRVTALYSLKNLEERLPADRFFRVHKSFIISINYIEDVDKQFVTVGGRKIPIGSNYRDELLKKLRVAGN